MDQKWYKYEFVCPYCDGLFNYTIIAFSIDYWKCPKCEGHLTLMSVVDATIPPTIKQKEETMETTIADLYNPNLLVTYKKITNGETEYKTEKVVDIEWLLENSRKNNERNIEMNNKVFKLENILHTYCQEADEPDMAFITEIAELFDISLTKEIEVTGTISFSATVRVSLTDDYDIESMVNDEISVSSYGGDVDVNDYSIEDVREVY